MIEQIYISKDDFKIRLLIRSLIELAWEEINNFRDK